MQWQFASKRVERLARRYMFDLPPASVAGRLARQSTSGPTTSRCPLCGGSVPAPYCSQPELRFRGGRRVGRRPDTIPRLLNAELRLLLTRHDERVLCRLLGSPLVRVYLAPVGAPREVTVNWIGGAQPALLPDMSAWFPRCSIRYRRSPTRDEVLAAVDQISQVFHVSLPVTTFVPPTDSLEPGVRLDGWGAFQHGDLPLAQWIDRLINSPCPVPAPKDADVSRAFASENDEVRRFAYLVLPHAVP